MRDHNHAHERQCSQRLHNAPSQFGRGFTTPRTKAIRVIDHAVHCIAGQPMDRMPPPPLPIAKVPFAPIGPYLACDTGLRGGLVRENARALQTGMDDDIRPPIGKHRGKRSGMGSAHPTETNIALSIAGPLPMPGDGGMPNQQDQARAVAVAANSRINCPA